MKLFHLAIAGQRHGQRNQRAHERAVDLLRAIRGRVTVRVEQPRPLHAAVRRDRPEADQIGKDGSRRATRVHAVRVSDLRVTISIRRIGKFQRNERIARRSVIAAIARKERVCQLASDEQGQKLAQHDRLVMPSKLARGGLEHVGRGRASSARPIDAPVVGAHEREVHLRHQHVGVVARVTDDGCAFDVAKHVEAVGRREELGRILALKQVWVAHRAVTVQAFQIQLG